MKDILLVEDDPSITKLLSLHFRAPDYRVEACNGVTAALQQLSASLETGLHRDAAASGERQMGSGSGFSGDIRRGSGAFDLIILDILLPDGNGIDLIRRIRQKDSGAAILMLSALGDERDKVMALELGADDYLTKPFGIAELMARVKALLRRRDRPAEIGEAETGAGVVPVGGAGKDSVVKGGSGTGGRMSVSGADAIVYRELAVDRNKRKVTMRGRRLELTPKEFDLLWLLAAHPGKTFSRHELLEIIWGFAFQEYEHTVTSHINRLRIKIEPNLDKPEYILTTWGAGYRFAE